MREDLADKGVDKEGDLGALDGSLGGVGGRKQVRGVGVGQELGHDGGLGDDGAVVGDGGDEAALDELDICIEVR